MIKANKTSVSRKRTPPPSTSRDQPADIRLVAAGGVAKVEKIPTNWNLSGQGVYFILALHIYRQKAMLSIENAAGLSQDAFHPDKRLEFSQQQSKYLLCRETVTHFLSRTHTHIHTPLWFPGRESPCHGGGDELSCGRCTHPPTPAPEGGAQSASGWIRPHWIFEHTRLGNGFRSQVSRGGNHSVVPAFPHRGWSHERKSDFCSNHPTFDALEAAGLGGGGGLAPLQPVLHSSSPL